MWRRGIFANQNAACKLRNRFTIRAVTEAFGLEHGTTGSGLEGSAVPTHPEPPGVSG